MIEEVIIWGTIQGVIYALLAMGFSLVYGVGGILNQAHGAFYVITTYIYYWIYVQIGGNFGLLIGIFAGLIITPIIAGIVYLLLIKPIRENHVAVVIVTFAFAFFIEQLVKILVDAKYHSMPKFLQDVGIGYVEILGVPVFYHYFLLLFVSIAVLIIVYVFINKMKIGKSIRAVAQDSEAASLMGINVDLVLMYTLMISGFLSAVAAILYVPVDIVAPHIGWGILINSFAIVILGGLGSLSGSVIGAFILAYANSFTNYFISPVFSALIPIIIIVIMLIFRPRGILGKKEID